MSSAEESDKERLAQYIGVGCFTTFIGAVSGGMIFVFVAKVVGLATGCTPDVPDAGPCNWTSFWAIGAGLGAVSLPILVLRRLRKANSKNKT